MSSTEPMLAPRRTLLLPGLLITALELGAALLLIPVFQPTEEQKQLLLRAALPILAGAWILWLAAMGAWLLPVWRALRDRRRGLPATEDAYRALGAVPLRSFFLRTGLWIVVAAVLGVLLARYSDWNDARIVALVSLTGLHAALVNVLRAAWYARIGAALRAPMFPAVQPLRQLKDRWFRRTLLISFLVQAGAAGALTAFIFFLLPIKREEYLAIQTYLPPLLAVTTLGWYLYARRARRVLDGYLDWQLAGGAVASMQDPRALDAYRSAQTFPYRLAGAKVFAWVISAGVVALIARRVHGVETDNAVLMLGAALVISVGAALYEAIWLRDTMRPLLVHVTVRHRVPVREVRTTLSLRVKLLVSFGGLVLFACGLSLAWGFIQYKTLATSYLSRQAQVRLEWVASEVAARASQSRRAPGDVVREVLTGAGDAAADGAVYYFIPDDDRPAGFGGATLGAPALPWYAVLRMRGAARGQIEINAIKLAGNYQHVNGLGTIAVLYPGYRGRGPGIERPLLELGVFFLVLVGMCAGIVIFTVSDFTAPIRKLEQRADEMARGELARSVTSGGEGDEVGRLTYALEEMRRALRDKIRSTEEVNLDLEREVKRRTADLETKNRELADALEKLTLAQSQLLHAEKMASIGQLVAGIAHEINNPVNAIANTVGPLRDALADGGTRDEIEHMIRVIQSGARRTKDIVQALHNYSRADDERVVEFDLNRGLDDSLELLRHHLKGAIAVERRYADVGRIKAHAGQLNQVFMNLLTNAAQALAGREGARIDVSTRRRGEEIVIQVADNGPGIPDEIVPRIFDPFFTTKEVGQGSGLGLSIAHGIVERHGGKIAVDTEIGVGTTFTVTLPTEPPL
ncbi:MAG TPA: ATP-binding protein [Haliangiales bacterium]|nr:ATP-binding protein [Haliangiales bacterium]